MRIKKTGIIGCGVVGKKRKKYIIENPNFFELSAISDITYKKNFLKRGGIKYYKNYQDIFDNDLDAIFICMPNYLAKDITIKRS